MKEITPNRLTKWLDAEWKGRPRSHWAVWILTAGIVVNLVVASFL